VLRCVDEFRIGRKFLGGIEDLLARNASGRQNLRVSFFHYQYPILHFSTCLNFESLDIAIIHDALPRTNNVLGLIDLLLLITRSPNFRNSCTLPCKPCKMPLRSTYDFWVTEKGSLCLGCLFYEVIMILTKSRNSA
jgi:hypothetical protein